MQSPHTMSSPAQSQLVAPIATLPLESVALRVTARGGVARVILEQRFANLCAEPLTVTYVLPLPADGAVSGFSFRVGDRRIEGEIEKKRAARERYDEAIASGRTAALLEQDRSSLFTQEIGNVPPGARVVCEIAIDQPLRWLDEGAWEWRFPLAAAPRYLGEAGRVPDAERIAFDVALTTSARASLAMEIADALVASRTPESPSHPLQCQPMLGGHRVELGSGNRVELDRDVVVRWPVGALEPSVSAHVEGTHALLTLVPPRPDVKPASVSRDLIVLLDTSGSMSGAPLEQARRVTMALVDSLGDGDTLELIEFSNAPRRFRASAVPATKPNKAKALSWLSALAASGGTEMKAGILEALASVNAESQRQVVVITDGQIGFEQEIIETIRTRLPSGARVHTVGVGSSVNRSLTGPAARAGQGIEVILGLGEDPERAVSRLRARTEMPIVVDLSISGAGLIAAAPAKIPDLYAGAPVLVSARLRTAGGELVLRGRTRAGSWEQRVRVTPTDAPARTPLAALFAREAVEDLETELAAGGDRKEIDRRVEELGVRYAIATRLTSWIAIDATPSVDPLAPTRRAVVPQALPFGMSVDGLGLRASHETSTEAGEIDWGQPLESRSIQQQRGRAILAETDARSQKMAERMKDAPARRRPRPMVRGSFTGASVEFLPARIIRREGAELTVEVTVNMGELEWDPATFDILFLAGRIEAKAQVDLTRSTRAGKLTQGQVARIALTLDEATEAAIVEIVFARFACTVR